MDKFLDILKSAGFPYAYDHFAEGEAPDPPFLCYDQKDLAAERKMEDALDAAGVFYNKTETWIESEKLYEVLYSFEMEGVGNVYKEE